jgi:hypothetical protein
MWRDLCSVTFNCVASLLSNKKNGKNENENMAMATTYVKIM